LACGTAGAKASDLLAEGGVTVTEAVGDVLLATAIDDDGAEGFVEALEVGNGLEEEATSQGVVHEGAPECDSGDGRSPVRGQVKRARVV
jgi:hypothetical protein